MPSKKEKYIVLYPEYFNSKYTRSEGRRVPKKFAKSSPTVEDIEKAAKSIGLSPVVERDKSYPKFWFEKRGRVLVKKNMPKTELLKKIGKAMAK